MHRVAILLFAAALPSAAVAGFAVKDLASIEAAAKAAFGPDTLSRASRDQLLLTCSECDGEPTVSVTIGRQDDGTEARVRSGATTMADLQKLCQARSPECRLTALPVAPAVGWITSYRLGGTAGATAVILRDGDLLTVRSLAADAKTARASIDRLLPVLRARVIGR